MGKTVLLKIVAFFIFAGNTAAYSCKSKKEPCRGGDNVDID